MTRHLTERLIASLGATAAFLPLCVLVLLLGLLLRLALPQLDPHTPWWSVVGVTTLRSALLLLLAAMVAVPVGVGAAIYLEEYAGDGLLARMSAACVSMLTQIPPLLYGLVGLEVWVRTAAGGLAAGGLTLALLLFPLVVRSAQRALRAVPDPLREGALVLGASPLQVIRGVVLPRSAARMVSGVLSALSLALGEAASLVLLLSLAARVSPAAASLSVLPVEIFYGLQHPDAGALGGVLLSVMTLLGVLLVLNGIALGILTFEKSPRTHWGTT